MLLFECNQFCYMSVINANKYMNVIRDNNYMTVINVIIWV